MRLSTNQSYFARIVKNKMGKCLTLMILLVLMVGVKAETVSNEITQLSTLAEPYDYHDNEVHIEPSVATSADEDKLKRFENFTMNMEKIIEQLHKDLKKIRGIKSVKMSLVRKVSEIGVMRETNKGEIHQLLTMDVSEDNREILLEKIKERTKVMENTVKWLSMFTVLVDTMKILENGEQLPEFQKTLDKIINN